MKVVFADSFYFFALLNPNDTAHEKAMQFSRAYDGGIVSKAWVFTELADGLAAPRDRAVFSTLLDYFAKDPHCRLVPPTEDLFFAATDLYRNRPDKEWSLTDCVSFVVMQNERLTDALTGDRHFTQAGFKALLS